MYPPPTSINGQSYSSLFAKSMWPSKSLSSRWMEWNIKDSSQRLSLKGSDLIEFSVGSRPEAACIRTTIPIDPSYSIFYWEVTVLQSSSSCSPIAIGLSVGDGPLNRFPGWEPGSYGYHGDDGHIFGSAGVGTLYGPTFGNPGDSIGCLVTFSNSPDKERLALPTANVRFTKNGHLLSVAFSITWDSYLKHF